MTSLDNVYSKLAQEESDEGRLTIENIIALHDAKIDAYGGQYGIRDQSLLESISFAPYQELFGEVLYPGLFDKAAKYLFDFANYQVFFDGNKRTGLAAAQALLQINGFDFKPDFDTKAYILVLDIANHRYKDSSEIVDIIKDNVTLLPQTVKEHGHQPKGISL